MTRTTNNKRFGWLAALALAVFLPAAHANTLASLNDWCFNVDGTNVMTNFCNTGQTTVTFPTGVNGANYDFTLDTQTEGNPSVPSGSNNDQNTLGSVTITLPAGASQFVLAYMDYDLNYPVGASYQDFASTHGALASGESYSLNDPSVCTSCSVSDIFDHFAANTLDDVNHVGTYASVPTNPVCCDVSWAIGLNLNVAAGTQDLVTFTVSNTTPTSGFYLQQTNGLDNSQNIYLQAMVQVQQVGGGGVPEPASWLLIGGGLAGAILLRRRMASAARA